MIPENFEPRFMERAVELARKGSESGKGGPFGAVVVKDGVIVGEGSNMVSATNDPSAHAEVVAIRNACRTLNDFQLTGCVIYTSCEPCPMCLGAIYWARPKQVFFASLKKDAAQAGFDDAFIYDEIQASPKNRQIPMHFVPDNSVLAIFRNWISNPNKVSY